MNLFKSLKMHKSIPKIIGNPPEIETPLPKCFSGCISLSSSVCFLHTYLIVLHLCLIHLSIEHFKLLNYITIHLYYSETFNISICRGRCRAGICKSFCVYQDSKTCSCDTGKTAAEEIARL